MDNYKDIDGNPCTLQALCRKEPEWAASQIATLKDYTTGNEKVIATLRARVKELEAEPRCHCKWTTEPGKLDPTLIHECQQHALENMKRGRTTPAERDVIEAAIGWLGNQEPDGELAHFVTILLKEREERHG